MELKSFIPRYPSGDDAAQQAGCCSAVEPLDRRFLGPERLQECERKLSRVEELLGESSFSFFDLDRVQATPTSFEQREARSDRQIRRLDTFDQ
jgi:hypothetical protein